MSVDSARWKYVEALPAILFSVKQYVIHVGETVRVRDGEDKVVVSFLARTAFDYVAYVIAERGLWVRARG